MTYQDVYLMDNLTIEAKAIYGMLCSYAGTGGTAYPSVEFICNSLQISERRFYTHMNLLIGAGIVEKQICRKNGKRSNNLYVLTPNIHFQPVENESVENLSVENVGSNNNTINNNNTNNNNRNLLGGLYRENPVKSRNYEAVKSSKKWENVGNSYIIPALLLYRYSYI